LRWLRHPAEDGYRDEDGGGREDDDTDDHSHDTRLGLKKQ
jgi:hypothetical protein